MRQYLWSRNGEHFKILKKKTHTGKSWEIRVHQNEGVPFHEEHHRAR